MDIVFFLILDIFQNKTKGIFTLLNDECMKKTPTTENFTKSLKNAWNEEKFLPISWRVVGQRSKENSFLIRHFTHPVIYSTVSEYLMLAPGTHE